jgi:hypothetical protein
MPGMPFLELKGSVVDKSNKIKGCAPTLYETRNARRLVHNPNDVLSPYALYQKLRGFAHPDQVFIYCYKANRGLLDQYESLPDCQGFQTNPTRRIGKNSIGKVRLSNQLVLSKYSINPPRPLSTQFCVKLNEKAKIENGHVFRNHCWREFGLGTLANSNVSIAEQMKFSRHSNPSSHIAYVRAGHNSDFAFQKVISGAPMPNKKLILSDQAATKQLARMTKTKPKNTSTLRKKAPQSEPKMNRKVVRKATPPVAPTYMKAPPKVRNLISPPATRARAAAVTVRKSKRAPKPKKRS